MHGPYTHVHSKFNVINDERMNELKRNKQQHLPISADEIAIYLYTTRIYLYRIVIGHSNVCKTKINLHISQPCVTNKIYIYTLKLCK